MSTLPYGNQPARTLLKGMAVASLVLGMGLVLSTVVVGGLFGLVAERVCRDLFESKINP